MEKFIAERSTNLNAYVILAIHKLCYGQKQEKSR